MTVAHGLDPALDVRLGDRHATVALDDLAAATGVPARRLRGVLLSLLLTSRARAGAASPCLNPVSALEAEGEATEGESGRSERSPMSQNKYESPRTSGTSESRRSDAREAGDDGPSLAQRIAASLGDAQNLAALERVVRRYPETVVLRALELTLRVPRGHIRKSPGAYFTGVLATLTRNPNPHDRIAPPAP